MRIFNPGRKSTRAVAALAAASVLAGSVAGAAGAAAASNNTAASGGVSAAMPSQTAMQSAKLKATSNVPTSVTRAETAAEDVIGLLEKGNRPKSDAEAQLLAKLASGAAGSELAKAGIAQAKIHSFQVRAQRTAALSKANAPAIQVSVAANSVSQLMPHFYAKYSDPVPASVLKLDYLEREAQLRSRAGQQGKVGAAIKSIDATWSKLRPRLVKAGGISVARNYDAHIRALKQSTNGSASIQKEGTRGLDIVDQIEGVFLGK